MINVGQTFQIQDDQLTIYYVLGQPDWLLVSSVWGLKDWACLAVACSPSVFIKESVCLDNLMCMLTG